jgi:hypothetical protein
LATISPISRCFESQRKNPAAKQLMSGLGEFLAIFNENILKYKVSEKSLKNSFISTHF